MKIFINTFLKILASLFSITVFIVIISLFLNYLDSQMPKNQFKFVEVDYPYLTGPSENKIVLVMRMRAYAL